MPKRIQRKRTKGWRMPDGAVYVGRGSKWGNTFPVSELMPVEAAVALYRKCLEEAIARRGQRHPSTWSVFDRMAHHLEDLKGKDLACWCRPSAICHGDALLELANADRPGE